MSKAITFVFLCLLSSYLSEAAKILVVFPLPGKSHALLGEGICRHLLAAGNEVTYITPFPPKNPQQNFHIVDVSDVAKYLEEQEEVLNIKSIMDKTAGLDDMKFLAMMMDEMNRLMLRNKNVQKLLGDATKQFDVAIVEWMFSELNSGISAVLNCPYIWVSTIEPHWTVMRLIDEPLNPAYNADSLSSNMAPFTFTQRVQELWAQIMLVIFKDYVYGIQDEKHYKEIFEPLAAKRGRVLPPYGVIKYNASLMLGNSHVSMGDAVRLPQSYIPIGGYHIDSKAKPLPEDLQKLMDNAKHGVIYFSMGSNLKSKDLPDVTKKNLLNMFRSLKQIVIWKFEEVLPDLPPNVHILQWAPQHSILSHPNCLLFISHGGLLSTTETIHFGVPIIGIPVFGDQFVNVNRAVKRGIGRRIELSYSMADDLKLAIDDVLSNPKYREKVKELSLIYHDRPVAPGAELVHWVEHVVRTRGAPHLRSPALLVPLYQKLYLDLIALILVLICAIKFVIKRVFFSKKKSNIDKTKKNK